MKSDFEERKKDMLKAGTFYFETERTLTLLDLFHEYSDEKNKLKQSDIAKILKNKYQYIANKQTLSRNIDKMIRYLNTYENRLMYDGIDDENLNLIELKELYMKLQKLRKEGNGIEDLDDFDELDDETREKLDNMKKAPGLTGLYYKHPFTYEELNLLIEAVNFHSKLSPEEKKSLISSIKKTASNYYTNSTIDGMDSVTSIFKNRDFGKTDFYHNIEVIKEAINRNKKVSFNFYGYNAQKELEPTVNSDGSIKEYVLNPYYMVAYNDNYYLIGNHDWNNSISFYRIDLMKKVTVEDGKERRSIKEVDDLKNPNEWNATKFMNEHLNMSYDSPQYMRLNIPKQKYTMIHDWFGDNYKYIKSIDDETDQIEVKCTPFAMTHFAMQYGANIEVVTPEIRDKIKDEIELMIKKYGFCMERSRK